MTSHHTVSKQDSEDEEDQPEFSGEKSEMTDVALRVSVCGYWREGPAVRNSGYSYRGPLSNSQHPHGDSQLSVTPVPGESSGLQRHQVHTWYTDLHAGKALIHRRKTKE